MYIKNISIANNGDFSCEQINLILGPNSSGKSTFLKELNEIINICNISENEKWFDSVSVEISNIKDEIQNLFPEINLDEQRWDLISNISKKNLTAIFGSTKWNSNVHMEIKSLQNKKDNYQITRNNQHNSRKDLFEFYFTLKSSIEECRERLNGPFSSIINNLSDPFQDIIHFLYFNEKIFKNISDNIYNVFKKNLLFDNLPHGNKPLRLSQHIIDKKILAKLSIKEQIEYWNNNTSIVGNEGDGIKAYIKLLLSIYNPAKSLLFIDEPETFLHPPQKRELGRFIGKHYRDKQIFIATHDSEFVRGIISSGNNLNIFQLTQNKKDYICYQNKLSEIKKSTSINESVINSYFNESTVVCEAEDDRLIYELAFNKFSHKLPVNTNFIGGNGKNESVKIFNILLKNNVKAILINDFDSLYSGEYIEILDGNIKTESKKIKNDFNVILDDENKKEIKKDIKENGIKSKYISTKFKKTINNHLEKLRYYRIIILSEGELESLFYKVNGTKKIQNMINQFNKKYSNASKNLKKISKLIKEINET